MSQAVPGACLLDIGVRTQSSVDQTSWLFAWRYAGVLLGLPFIGHIFDRMDNHFVLGLSLMGVGITMNIAPWWSEVIPVFVTFGIMGLFTSGISIGTSKLISLIWVSKRASYLQGLHLMSTLGGAISAQIARPFLLNSTILSESELLATNSSQYHDFHEGNITLDKTLLDLQSKVRIQYPFIIIGSSMLLISVFHLFFISDCVLFKRYSKDNNDSNEMIFRSRYSKFIILFGFFWIPVFVGGTEEAFGSFLQIFCIEFLTLDQSTATILLFAFWLSQTVGRGMGIIVARFLSTSSMMLINSCLCTLSILIMLLLLQKSIWVAWTCIPAVGLALSTSMPATVTWFADTLGSSGLNMAVVFAGNFVGKMVTPSLIAYLSLNVSDMALLYVAITYTSMLLFIVVILKIWISHKRKISNMTKPNAPLDLTKEKKGKEENINPLISKQNSFELKKQTKLQNIHETNQTKLIKEEHD